MVDRRTSVVAGLTVAAIGVVPLLWLATTHEQPGSSSPTATMATSPVASSESPPSEIGAEAQPPEIAGLSESVTRVLVSHGFAGSDGLDELPASVARVLADRGITLTVATATGEGT